MRRLGRILRNIGLGLLILIILLAAGGTWFVRRPWPQIDGQAIASGLSAPVQLIRDKWGVPHIYAQNDHDLFFGQGYAHAQDRLWQMEINRNAGKGTLSSFIGPSTLETDRTLLTIGFRREAQKDWDKLDADSRAALEAYSQGVNAFIDTHRDRLPIEYTLLGVSPAPWTSIDTLTWGKIITFDLGGNHRLELLRAQMIAQIGEDKTQQLLPRYDSDMPLIIPPEVKGYDSFKNNSLAGLKGEDDFFGEPGPVTGSNNWAVAGSRTATGKPLLANDTHLNVSRPSIWYENGLHGGRFNVIGFTFAGVPGVLVGHNDRIAWGVSSVNPDIQDLYIEKLNDRTKPTKYEYQGQQQDIQVIHEMIEVKNQAPEPLDVYITGHGPLINDVVDDTPGSVDPIALRWTALDGSTQFQAVLQLDRANNWEEFRHALSIWDVPSLNFIYADVDGNIGYQAPGRIPIRAAGHQGTVPVPGWTGEFEWQGYIPFEEMPHALNPSTGFLASGNNKIVSDDYPYVLANEWDPGYRAKRITDLLAADSSVTIEDMQKIQADTYSLGAEAMAPYLLATNPEDDLSKQALDLVGSWDKHYEIDRAGASVYQVWYWFFLRNTLNDDLGKDLGAQYLAGYYERHGTFQLPFMITISAQNDNPWFDDITTSQVETRDDMVRRSLTQATAWLRERYGDDPAQWAWGRLHMVTFRGSPLGRSGIPVLESFFRSEPIPARGDNFTVNAGSFRYSNPFVMVHGTSMREIIDLGDLDNSLMIQTTGQNGQAFHPHNQDFMALWQNVQYHPMFFDRTRIEQNAEGTLTLTPP